MANPGILTSAMVWLDGLCGSFGVRYAITGGVAAIEYGDPRTTQDLDVLLEWPQDQELRHRLVEALERDGIVNGVEPGTLRVPGGCFQVFHNESATKLDVYVRELLPGQFDRAVRREFLPGRQAVYVSPEDSLASKLYWISEGSHRSRKDVLGILANTKKLNQELLERLADSLNVRPILRELQAEANRRREDDLPFERVGD
ncbi:MAG: hypothetical protein ACREJO_11185 [Phycisphaerales bacterium]